MRDRGELCRDGRGFPGWRASESLLDHFAEHDDLRQTCADVVVQVGGDACAHALQFEQTFLFIVPDALVQNYAPSVQDFQLLPTSTA
jgi:hypothetical protein